MHLSTISWSVYLVVIGGIGEGQWQQTLFLQVCLVDASKRFDNDGASAQVTWLQSGMLAGRALAVVLITDSDPLNVVGLVVASNLGHIAPCVGTLVLDLVHLVVLGVGGTNEHVVGDVVQMTTVLQPGTGSRDVIGGALSLNLNQHGQIRQILTVPFVEGLQQLQTLRFGIDSNLNVFTVLKENTNLINHFLDSFIFNLQEGELCRYPVRDRNPWRAAHHRREPSA